ncbi:MAG: hypothetical protein AAF548_00025 [Actinomycetota bacterium]
MKIKPTAIEPESEPELIASLMRDQRWSSELQRVQITPASGGTTMEFEWPYALAFSGSNGDGPVRSIATPQPKLIGLLAGVDTSYFYGRAKLTHADAVLETDVVAAVLSDETCIGDQVHHLSADLRAALHTINDTGRAGPLCALMRRTRGELCDLGLLRPQPLCPAWFLLVRVRTMCLGTYLDSRS